MGRECIMGVLAQNMQTEHAHQFSSKRMDEFTCTNTQTNTNARKRAHIHTHTPSHSFTFTCTCTHKHMHYKLLMSGFNYVFASKLTQQQFACFAPETLIIHSLSGANVQIQIHSRPNSLMGRLFKITPRTNFLCKCKIFLYKMYVTIKLDDKGYKIHSISDGDKEIVMDKRFFLILMIT